ncbi:MAG: plasmid replication initiator TrfA [Bacillota bacterium]
MTTVSKLLDQELQSQGFRPRGRLNDLERPSLQFHSQTQNHPSQQNRLPHWPDPVRGVPNTILRSALFGAIRRGRRTFMQQEPIASYKNVIILQTGPRLDQADLDVWEQCMHLARTGGLGCRVQFSAHGFLRAIGRSTGGKDLQWLKGSFSRLASTVVEIKEGKRAYFGPMLHHGDRDDETGHYSIQINPSIISLYGSDGWSQVEWAQRQMLKRQPLAQWLHGFYTSHAAPFPLKVETIHRLSGSEAKHNFHFRAELREALAKLEDAIGWTWWIDDGDRLGINKSPSGSQARYLRRMDSKASLESF